MKVTVIIPTLAGVSDEYLQTTVESLRQTVDWDIIVVSNGNTNKPDYSHIHGITIHAHTRDQGQCIAVNIGARLAPRDTDYLFISNDDMYYAPSWFQQLKDSEFEHLVFSPNLMEPNNNNGSAPPFLKCDGGYTLDEFNKKLVDNCVFDAVMENEPDETGFNFPVFIKKEVWDTIGGYDTNYDPWGSNSDTDLQAKIHLAGIQTMRKRNVVVYHFSNKSGTFDGTHQDAWQKNWDYFTRKWGFNRDMIPTDVWYSKNILPEDKSMINLNPLWKDKYANPGSR